MLRLILRKLALLTVLLPLLNFIGFQYALIHPYFFAPRSFGQKQSDGHFYANYLAGIAQGDFGSAGSAAITSLLATPLLNSLILIGTALLLTAVLGVLIGYSTISPQTGRVRPWGLILTTAGASIPGFLLGGVIISIIVYRTLYGQLGRSPLPLNGYGLDSHLILPLIVLALRPVLQLSKVTSGLLENELQKNYIRAVRSQGAGWARVFWRHAFYNILSPLIVVLGQSLRFIIGGLLIAETMFLWPGIGRFFVLATVANENIQGQQLYFANPPLLAALAPLMGGLLLTADLIADLIAYAADPRLRHQL